MSLMHTLALECDICSIWDDFGDRGLLQAPAPRARELRAHARKAGWVRAVLYGKKLGDICPSCAAKRCPCRQFSRTIFPPRSTKARTRVLLPSAFCSDKKSKDGLASYCRDCRNQIWKEYGMKMKNKYLEILNKETDHDNQPA